jgi:hypothetical protein
MAKPVLFTFLLMITAFPDAFAAAKGSKKHRAQATSTVESISASPVTDNPPLNDDVILNISETNYDTYAQLAILYPTFAGTTINDDFIKMIKPRLEKMKSIHDPIKLSSKLHKINDLMEELYSKHRFQYKGTLYALKDDLDEMIDHSFSLAKSIQGTTEDEQTQRYYLFNNLAKSPATSLEVLSDMVDLLDPINNKHKVVILATIAFHKRSSPEVLHKVLNEANLIKTGKAFESKQLRSYAYQIIVESLAMNPKKTPEISRAYSQITKNGKNKLFKTEINQIDPLTHRELTHRLGELSLQLHLRDLKQFYSKPVKF